ncbi:unnamed protein product, partial [Discosporangium mesarthrocarpum]
MARLGTAESRNPRTDRRRISTGDVVRPAYVALGSVEVDDDDRLEMEGNGANDAAPQKETRKSTVFACVVTMTNTLLGVSVVGVAGGFAKAGCGAGTLLMVLFATLGGCGLHLLASTSLTVCPPGHKKITPQGFSGTETAATGGGGGGTRRSRTAPPAASFRSVATVAAPRWAFLIDVAVAFKCFGVATSYLVVVGDLMPVAAADVISGDLHGSFLVERRFWVTVAILVAAPLAFSHTLGALRYTATLAMGLVVFLASMVASYWLSPSLDACPGVQLPAEYGGAGAAGAGGGAIMAAVVAGDG